MNFPTNYSSILKRVDAIDPIGYAKTRNFIDGGVTYLSPYISRGVISTKEIKELIFAKGYKYYQIEKFIQELAWREYFQRVWQVKGNAIDTELKNPQESVAHYQMIRNIENAQTEITAIDDQINNLYKWGYMHNHARMYTASIVCNIGKAHWNLPARWMYYHLLDGDLASNHCSWQWVASTFSSKKYYCNQENINKYCNSNQRNTFLDKSYEELPTMPIPAALKETVASTLETVLPTNETLNFDTSKPLLLYNSYNLDPNWRINEDVNRVLLLEPSHFKQYPVSEKVIQFVLDLKLNIQNLQVYVGELNELINLTGCTTIISKEHPAFHHYGNIKDERDWMFPKVTGFYNSFSSYWKQCSKYL